MFKSRRKMLEGDSDIGGRLVQLHGTRYVKLLDIVVNLDFFMS